MSSQKGNTQRTRPQKYQNHFGFKNTLYDTSHQTKKINSLQIANVCERCKKIIEWKIKYKKYKPLKALAKCNKCEQKTIKHAYHTMCGPCARERNACPKCENVSELVPPEPSKKEQIKLDAEMQSMLKTLPERKRRTFIRYMNKQTKGKRKGKGCSSSKEIEEKSENNEANDEEDEESTECTREHLLDKLKSLMIDEDNDNNDSDSNFSNPDSDSID